MSGPGGIGFPATTFVRHGHRGAWLLGRGRARRCPVYPVSVLDSRVLRCSHGGAEAPEWAVRCPDCRGTLEDAVRLAVPAVLIETEEPQAPADLQPLKLSAKGQRPGMRLPVGSTAIVAGVAAMILAATLVVAVIVHSVRQHS